MTIENLISIVSRKCEMNIITIGGKNGVYNECDILDIGTLWFV